MTTAPWYYQPPPKTPSWLIPFGQEGMKDLFSLLLVAALNVTTERRVLERVSDKFCTMARRLIAANYCCTYTCTAMAVFTRVKASQRHTDN